MADYYYTRQGKVRGPIPLEQIVKYVKARKLPVDTQVCAAGKKEWKPIQSVAPDTMNLASNAKIVGWTIGGAAGLILLLMGVLWLMGGGPDRSGDDGGDGAGGSVGTGGGPKVEDPEEKIVTEFTVTPGKRKIQKVVMDGKEQEVLIMDVELQSPSPVQVALTPKNVYVNGAGKNYKAKSEKYFVAPRSADYEISTDGEVKNLAMGTSSLVGFDDGELVLKLQGVKKYKISLMFFDPPGENVVLHFPPSNPWSGSPTVASRGGEEVHPDTGMRPAGGDVRDGEGAGNSSNGGKNNEEEVIVVGNVPDDFAFMPLSKVKDGDIADITEVLAGVNMTMDKKVDTPEEAQVALVSGDDVVTGLYGEGLRLFPVEAGAEVKMWITEPFAAYRKGTLIAVYDPTKEKFRRPRDEDGVPEKIEPPKVSAPTGVDPAMAPAGDPAMAPEGDAAGAGEKEMMDATGAP